MHNTGPHQQLQFPGGGQRRGIHRLVRVDQHDPTGVFGLRRKHQTPDRRGGQIADILAGQTHRTMGQHRQRPHLVGQPALQNLQGGAGGAMYRAHMIVTKRLALPDHHTPMTTGTHAVTVGTWG